MAFAFVVEDAADESVEGLLELRDLGNPTDDLILQLLPFRIFHLRRMQQQVACIHAEKIWLSNPIDTKGARSRDACQCRLAAWRARCWRDGVCPP